MLVKDLKNEIKKYNSKDKDKIIVELYKRIPKNIKEDYDIDNFIVTLNSSKKEEIVNFEELEKEINYFLSCANNDLYATPNRIIPKVERSKWRFKVKRFYKELVSIPPDTVNGVIATDLLKSLYGVLSIGTVTLKFSSWNTFGAINVSQSEFLRTIIMRRLVLGESIENLSYCGDLLDMVFDPNEYHISVLLSFVTCLNTDNLKRMAIAILKGKINKLKIKLNEVKNNFNKSYYAIEDINHFIKCVLMIYADLPELSEGITYFKNNYIEKSKESMEYDLLEILDIFELNEEWIKEYEINCKDTNNIRLKERYEEKLKEM